MSALAPRWGPERPLAERITRRGRWEEVDPLRHGNVWSRWRWAALLAYGGLLTAAYAKAWRDHGGTAAFRGDAS